MRVEMEPTPEQQELDKQAQEAAAIRKKQTKTRYSLKEQWQKFTALPPGERFWYVWEYYKVHIFLIIAVIIFLYMAIASIIEGTKSTILEGVMININYEALETDFMTTGYLESRDIGTERNLVNLDTGLYINANSTGDYELASLTKVTALMQLKELDFVITEEYGLDYYAPDGLFADLSAVLPEDLYQYFDENGLIVYADVVTEIDDEGNPSQYEQRPTAILLNGSYCDEQLGFLNENVYFCIVFNTQRLDELLYYIPYLFQIEASTTSTSG